MPEKDYRWLHRSKLLSFEEITRLTSIFVKLGLTKVRLTGGEPLLRRNLPTLVGNLKSVGLEDLALTTNGVLLEAQHEALFQAGLSRITVSLDALDSELFARMSQRNDLDKVLKGLDAVAFRPGLKIDTVLIKGLNDGQILPLLNYAGQIQAEIRFIEYMDVGGATRWSREQVLSQAEILDFLSSQCGQVEALDGRGSAPAQRFRLPSGQIFGVIPSVTRPFCRTCDRVRLTADGQLFTCLYARIGRDLRALLRSDSCDREIAEFLSSAWAERDDQGAKDRASVPSRGPSVRIQELQENIHLEMHTRGG